MDDEHLRSALIDVAAMLATWGATASFCVTSVHGFLSPIEAPATYSELDLRLHGCDPGAIDDGLAVAGVAWFAENEAITADELRAFEVITARRRVLLVEAAGELLKPDIKGEMLRATLTLRDVYRRCSRWWFVEIESAAQPEMLGGESPEQMESQSLGEMLLDAILRVVNAS